VRVPGVLCPVHSGDVSLETLCAASELGDHCPKRIHRAKVGPVRMIGGLGKNRLCSLLIGIVGAWVNDWRTSSINRNWYNKTGVLLLNATASIWTRLRLFSCPRLRFGKWLFHQEELLNAGKQSGTRTESA
jgi:hypothetical protein